MEIDKTSEPDTSYLGACPPAGVPVAGAPVKPPRKPRSKSTFQLCKLVTPDGENLMLKPVAAGPTDKKLMAEAIRLQDDGEYVIVYTRRKFTVKTKQQTVIE